MENFSTCLAMCWHTPHVSMSITMLSMSCTSCSCAGGASLRGECEKRSVMRSKAPCRRALPEHLHVDLYLAEVIHSCQKTVRLFKHKQGPPWMQSNISVTSVIQQASWCHTTCFNEMVKWCYSKAKLRAFRSISTMVSVSQSLRTIQVSKHKQGPPLRPIQQNFCKPAG
eukprot:TRINITY_DN12276_c0_g1_i9.p1 TRINITY_DN12276_c0_g1~~TRINITY_DN12276_c0_g1_i9.p1  ORF type:complete len:169 (+),score=8.41 TRINITY_DN12276_c0_g1_i9:349-855(+)